MEFFFVKILCLITCLLHCVVLHVYCVSASSFVLGIGQVLVSHNNSCDNKVRLCNPAALLMCISGSCQCESPSNQRYDPISQTCLSVVGGQCCLQCNEGEDSPRICIPNAHCVQVSSTSYNYTECQCQPGFIENSEGNCVPGIGKECNYSPNECNPLGMVVCKNGRCNCLDELQVYDGDMRRCVSPAGTHCKYDSVQLGCVRNAICYPFYYWVPPRCICKPGYVQTKNRTCILEIEAVSIARSHQLVQAQPVSEDIE